jgi:hypothetical protein
MSELQKNRTISAQFFPSKFGVSPILQIHPNDYSIGPTQQRGLPNLLVQFFLQKLLVFLKIFDFLFIKPECSPVSLMD